MVGKRYISPASPHSKETLHSLHRSWVGPRAENIFSTGIRSSDRPVRSKSPSRPTNRQFGGGWSHWSYRPLEQEGFGGQLSGCQIFNSSRATWFSFVDGQRLTF